MAVTLVHGLSCAITALWEFAGVEVDIVFYSFQCMEILDKRKNIFTIFTNTQIMDRMFGSGSRISGVSTRTTHVILLTILTLGAGGRFDSHFWTQSGAPSPYLAFRAPPRFQAIYGVESVPRFQHIFGIQSAPLPLSSHIWC